MQKFLLIFLILFALQVPVQAQDGTCYCLVETDGDLPLMSSPLLGNVVTTVPPNTSYPIRRYARFQETIGAYLLEVDADTSGWIEVITLGTISGDCSLTEELLTAADFLDVCELTIVEPIMMFRDASLTEFLRDVFEDTLIIRETIGHTYIEKTTARNAISGRLYSGHAGPFRGYVPNYAVEYDDDCPEIVYESPVNAIAGEDTRLWSMPDAPNGRIFADIPTGTSLNVLAGPTHGIVSIDGVTTGDWYMVRHADYGTGWVWSARFELDTPFPPEPIASGIALENARLWTMPDAEHGTYIGTMTVGSAINLLSEPVQGVIRLDTGQVADWYYVENNRGRGGWLWVGRIQFD